MTHARPPRAALRRARPLATLGALLAPALLAPAPTSSARPEKIRAGHSYYSDELVERDSIRDIGTERNYEEVYQRYTYYEVVYDESERVVQCLEYERGEVIRTDGYRYAPDGSLIEHRIETPGAPAKIERFRASSPQPTPR